LEIVGHGRSCFTSGSLEEGDLEVVLADLLPDGFKVGGEGCERCIDGRQLDLLDGHLDSIKEKRL
jgi:hypothetical protein